MRTLSRREWNRLMLGGVVAWPLVGRGAQRPDSTIAGVRIGAQSYSFRSQPLETMIGSMRTIGLGFCELWQNHIETDERIKAAEGPGRREALRKWRLSVPLDLFREIRQKFDAAGITLTAYNLSFQRDFTDEEIRRGFEMARALGVDVITASAHLSVIPRVAPLGELRRGRVSR
jgi:sugar phosphate isomerase/epimerase